ncbi:hypothetical protein [Naumannella halotolerans]|uniref:Uncharacterized protein n=1 Tax=Naumannella halotolerans TaxID=993414 RepID=A0A4R7J1B5_9ACTN|nr:hypothetical protein [Naumannella halotolerans]TDT30890.1 hypothetical protein CLV29_2297 [Naumannella halotolerans]
MTTPRLRDVALITANDSLMIRFQFDNLDISAGTLLFGVFASSQDGTRSFQYGIKYLDAERIAYFVFDHASPNQQNWRDIEPTRSQTEVLAPFPVAEFDQLGPNPSLLAYVNVDGRDTQTESARHTHHLTQAPGTPTSTPGGYLTGVSALSREMAFGV